MNTQEAYDTWSSQYDNNRNRTRDVEALALRQELDTIKFHTCLEIGCGTGKNTAWLLTKAETITAIDLSANMLAKARSKIDDTTVSFIQADILADWDFTDKKYDLISFSLVLEHIENIELIFLKASKVIAPNGHLYLGELHPFKQYTGTTARFETNEGLQKVPCFTHHISHFTKAALKYGFEILTINEYFDEEDRTGIPRILTILFKRPAN